MVSIRDTIVTIVAIIWAFSAQVAAAQVIASDFVEPDPSVTYSGERVREAGSTEREIIVSARRIGVLASYPPDRILASEDIAAYGASDVGQLIARISQAEWAGAASVVVLIDGRRVALRSAGILPPEAIERIEVLPEGAGSAFAGTANARVLNVRLRRDFAAWSFEGHDRVATRGGRYQADGEAKRTVVKDIGRAVIAASLAHDSPLTEGERGLSGAARDGRTLLPARDKASIEGSISREIGDVSLSLYSQILTIERDILAGLPVSMKGAPLRQHLRNESVSGGVTLDGSAGAWTWSVLGDVLHRRDRSAIEREGAAGRAYDRTRSRSTIASLDALSNGPLGSTGAGQITASADLELSLERYSEHGSLISPPGRFARDGIRLNTSVHIPLAPADSPVGGLAIDLGAQVAKVSAFAALPGFSLGANWRPSKTVRLKLSYDTSKIVPDIDGISSIVTLLPNQIAYDYATARAAVVDYVTGGNAALRGPVRRGWSARLELRPIAKSDWRIIAHWRQDQVARPVGHLPIVLPQVEAVFPNRFVRDAAGNLLRIDSRPVNFDSSQQSSLVWGTSLDTRLGPKPDAGTDERATLRASLYHTLRLEDRLTIAPGGPVLDYLDGSPSGALGGRPRNSVRGEVAFHRGGIGVEADADWRAETRVRAATAAAKDLRYDSLLQLGMRLFADVKLLSRQERSRSLRIEATFENLLDDRPTVRDAAGQVPEGLEPARLDPLGRTVRIGVRALF